MKIHLSILILLYGLVACVQNAQADDYTVTRKDYTIGDWVNGKYVTGTLTFDIENSKIDSLYGYASLNSSDTYSGTDAIICNLKNSEASQLRVGYTISDNAGYGQNLAQWSKENSCTGSVTVTLDNSKVGKEGQQDAIRAAGGTGTYTSGMVSVNITNGSQVTGNVYAGPRGTGYVGGSSISIDSTSSVKGDIYGGAFLDEEPYDSGDAEVGSQGISINVQGKVEGNIYAAGEDTEKVAGDVNVTVSGENSVSGGIYALGKGSTVLGKTTLNIGTNDTAYKGTIAEVAEFDFINVNKDSTVSLTSFTTGINGTTIDVAEGATLELSLSDVMVSGSSSGISLEGSGNVSLNTENLAYTFVVTNEMLAAGGEHTFTLMEGSGSVIANTYSSMIQSGVDINFVLEDGTAFIPETISGLEILFLEDAELSGSIVIGPNGELIMPTSNKQAIVVKATIPEPATATLSLLALAALAARRRRR